MSWLCGAIPGIYITYAYTQITVCLHIHEGKCVYITQQVVVFTPLYSSAGLLLSCLSDCYAVPSSIASMVTAYEAVRNSLGPERLLWHGTSWDSVANIARHGFNRAYAYGSAARHRVRLFVFFIFVVICRCVFFAQ